MRIHRKHQRLLPRMDAQALRELLEPRFLLAARLEPVMFGASGGAMLDLSFTDGKRHALVPAIEVLPSMLEVREASPLIWPAAIAQHVRPQQCDEIERAVLPWIESLTLGRTLHDEAVRVFGPESGEFERARDAGFLCAASYERVERALAPYAHAVRFAEGKSIAIADREGACGAALLENHALAVRADLGADLNDFAARWFGRAIYGEVQGHFDVAIGAVQSQAPVRIALRGDGSYSVQCDAARSLRDSSIAPPAAVGGSAGRILFLLRERFDVEPDSDTDDARVLAQWLRAEGFTVDLRAQSDVAAVAGYDLVHAWTLHDPSRLLRVLASAKEAGLPVVLTPFAHDVCAQAVWGTGIVPALLRMAYDETQLEEYLASMIARRLEAPGLDPKRQEPHAGYERGVREVLQFADCVLVYAPEDETLLRSLGSTAPVLPAGVYLPEASADGKTAALLAGTGDFIFCHAPVEPRANQFLLVRAAASAGLPLLLAGPVVDDEYYERLRDFAPPHVVFAGELPEDAAAAVYATARVFADVSWSGRGLHRLARAAAGGAALVVARDSRAAQLWKPGLWEVDPANAESIAVALGDAWIYARERRAAIEAAAARAAALWEPQAALGRAVAAYACAQDRCAKAGLPA